MFLELDEMFGKFIDNNFEKKVNNKYCILRYQSLQLFMWILIYYKLS